MGIPHNLQTQKEVSVELNHVIFYEMSKFISRSGSWGLIYDNSALSPLMLWEGYIWQGQDAVRVREERLERKMFTIILGHLRPCDEDPAQSWLVRLGFLIECMTFEAGKLLHQYMQQRPALTISAVDIGCGLKKGSDRSGDVPAMTRCSKGNLPRTSDLGGKVMHQISNLCTASA